MAGQSEDIKNSNDDDDDGSDQWPATMTSTTKIEGNTIFEFNKPPVVGQYDTSTLLPENDDDDDNDKDNNLRSQRQRLTNGNKQLTNGEEEADGLHAQHDVDVDADDDDEHSVWKSEPEKIQTFEHLIESHLESAAEEEEHVDPVYEKNPPIKQEEPTRTTATSPTAAENSVQQHTTKKVRRTYSRRKPPTFTTVDVGKQQDETKKSIIMPFNAPVRKNINKTSSAAVQDESSLLPTRKSDKNKIRRKCKPRPCRISVEEMRQRSDVVWRGANKNEPYLICNFPPCKKEIAFDKAPASKRFCSNSCAKRYNVFCSQRMREFKERQVAAGLEPYIPSRRKRRQQIEHEHELMNDGDEARRQNLSENELDDDDDESQIMGGSENGGKRTVSKNKRQKRGSISGSMQRHPGAGRRRNYHRDDNFINDADDLQSTSPSALSSSMNSSVPISSAASVEDDAVSAADFAAAASTSSSINSISTSSRRSSRRRCRDGAPPLPTKINNNRSHSSNSAGSGSNFQPETDIPSSSGGVIIPALNANTNTPPQPTKSQFVDESISIENMMQHKPLVSWSCNEIAQLVRHVIPITDDITTASGENKHQHSVAQKFLAAHIDGEAFMIINLTKPTTNNDLKLLLGHALKLNRKRSEILQLEVNQQWMAQHNVAL